MIATSHGGAAAAPPRSRSDSLFPLPSRAGEKMYILACEVYTATSASIGFPPLDVVCI